MDMNIMQFVTKDMLPIIVALIGIGNMLKNTKIDNGLIPFILLPLGVALSMGVSMTFNMESALKGILCTIVSVYGHQLYKQGAKVKNNIS